MKWFKIRSWHAVKFESRVGIPRAYCGKWGAADAPVADELPAEKSCESCLRITARLSDAA